MGKPPESTRVGTNGVESRAKVYTETEPERPPWTGWSGGARQIVPAGE